METNTNFRKYKFLVNGDGRNNADVLELNEFFGPNDQKFIAHNETDRSYIVFDTYQQFKQWFDQSPSRSLHEVICSDAPQKLKFDIDAAAEFINDLPPVVPPPTPVLLTFGDPFCDEILADEYAAELQKYNKYMENFNAADHQKRCQVWINSTITEAIKTQFQQCYDIELAPSDIVIADSSDQTKFSRHYVIANFHVINNDDAKLFAMQVVNDLPDAIKTIVDTGVYKKLQNFRLPDCHKVGSGRIKTIISAKYGHTFADAVITQNTGSPLPSFNIVPIKPVVLEQMNLNDEQILALAKPYTTGHAFSRKVNNLYLFKRTAASKCPICDKNHDADNTLMVSVSKYGNVKLHCRLSQRFTGQKSTLIIGQVNVAANLAAEKTPKLQPFDIKKYIHCGKNTKLPDEFSVVKYNNRQCQPLEFLGGKYDTLLVKSPMGTGKTKAVRDYINNLTVDPIIIIVSFRRSFTTEIKTNFAGFVDYQDIKGPLNMQINLRLIVQFESLHRLIIPGNERPVLTILDESESILSQVENKQMVSAGTLESCWKKFEWLMYNSTKLLAMDAAADIRTYDLLRLTRKSVCAMVNEWCPPAEVAPTDFYYENENHFYSAIFDAAPGATAAPFVVVSNSISKAKFIYEQCQKLAPVAKIRMYNSESGQEMRDELRDVNTSWANIDILIYTSTISAGCSFEQPRFAKMFAYFTSKSTDYKCAIQMMGRIRNLSENQYHIYINNVCAGLPTRRPDIEKILRTVNGTSKLDGAGINNNLVGAPRFINALGEEDFRVKDLYYHVHVNNIVFRCESMNYFRSKFVTMRVGAGINIASVRMDLTPQKNAAIAGKKKSSIKAQTEKQNMEIAGAPAIDGFEADELRQKQYLSKVEAASLSKHGLAEFYRVPEEVITAEFVAKYDNRRSRRAFFNLQRMKLENINSSASEWVRLNAGHEKAGELARQTSNAELLKVLFAIDGVNILFNDMCKDINKFHKRYICRPLLVDKIDSVIEYFAGHLDLISYLFELKTGRMGDLKTRDLKQKLAFINSILTVAFDMKIVLDRSDRDMFYLQPTGKFWLNNDGIWIVSVNK